MIRDRWWLDNTSSSDATIAITIAFVIVVAIIITAILARMIIASSIDDEDDHAP